MNLILAANQDYLVDILGNLLVAEEDVNVNVMLLADVFDGGTMTSNDVGMVVGRYMYIKCTV